MRYAILSDVHGNFAALDAVLADCKSQEIDRYLFLGDYYGEIPMQNEVLARIRGLADAYVIRGNKEDRMIGMKQTDPRGWTSEQLAPLYWTLNNLHEDHYRYIENLPNEISFTAGGVKIHMAHEPSRHFGYGVTESICARTFFDQFGKDYADHTAYLAYIRDILEKDQAFSKALSEKPGDVYLFGHYHTQWHARINGKLLINPGSCGMPGDFDVDAPYTVLDTEGGLMVTERRIPYDRAISQKALKDPAYFEIAPFWNSLAMKEIETAGTTIFPFLEFVEALAVERGETARPVSNALWREAGLLYGKAKEWLL